MKGFVWNIPNALSVARIACLPAALVAVVGGWETAFVALFVFAQITDILDGYLARRLHLESEAGALLDSYGDIGSYVMAAAGLVRFHSDFLKEHWPLLAVFATLYILNIIIAKLRWGRAVAGLHLYASKAMGYLQGSLLVVLFVWGFWAPLFYLALGWGILAEVECIAINLVSRAPVLNAKTIFHAWREGRLR